MWLIRRRAFLPQLLLLAAIIVLLFLVIEHHQLLYVKPDCIQAHTTDRNDPKLYFETDKAYKTRLKLQEKIIFGARLKELSQQVFNEREGYNESFLDSLPLQRYDIRDFRPEQCVGITYKNSETKVSVVINFHNELLSLLLRSIISVLKSIPKKNFHELILIDDGSNLDQHFDLLEVEPLVSLWTVKVKYIRFEENRGLIYSRRFGCQVASGDVWTTEARILAFDRYLNWINIDKEKKEYDIHKPFKTPAILGGAFIASKKFLQEIDYFGRGMQGWGYENIELAMKYWMCGGEVYYVPCSRVLHYAAERSPMNHGDRKKAKHYLHNAGLIIKSYFSEDVFNDYDLHYNVSKDVQEHINEVEANKDVLQRNKCQRDYSWMRRNLMPKVDSFDNDTTMAINLQSNKNCIGLVQNENEPAILFFKKCPSAAPECTKLRLTIWHELRIHDRMCLDWGYPRIRFLTCHGQGGNQITYYNAKRQEITNVHKTQCLVQYLNTTLLDKGPCNLEEESFLGAFKIRKFDFETVYSDSFLL
ncbi:hypothetical protein ACHWQZ_G018012 [Mnemiopsis leidyi]